MSRTLFDDEEFMDHVIGLLTQDEQALHTLSPLLDVEDFKPLRGMQWGQQRWVVADRALAYYQRFHQPLGRLLRADILEYAQGLQLNDRQIEALESYVTRLGKIKLNGAEAITEKVTAFKLQRIKAATIQELIDLQSTGELTDEKWLELSQKAINVKNGHGHAISYFDSLADRQDRRRLKHKYNQNPALLIEPLDEILYPGLAPKQLGLVIAPYGRGKSFFLIWLALAYTLQHYNVLFITLEDSQDDVEARLDSAISGIPFTQLETDAATVRSRFASYQRLVQSNLSIIDGTEDKYTPAMVEQRIREQREQGFRPDVLLIDYDDYLRPNDSIKSQHQKQDAMDSVYRDIKYITAQNALFTWMAAQTQRNTSGIKILTGDKAADDIGKIRKAVIAISLGKGEMGEESLYCWLAKNKFGRGNRGCHIISDLDRSIIYDHEKTRKAINAAIVEEEKEEELE